MLNYYLFAMRHRFRVRRFTYLWIWVQLIVLISYAIGSVESFNLFPNDVGNDYHGDGHSLLSQASRVRSRRAAIEDGMSAINEAESLVPKNYSIHAPPMTEDGNPINVDFYVLIVDVRGINEVNEELTLELNLQIYWKDSRLSHLTDKGGNGNNYVVLNPVLLKEIWHPDIYIDHVKKVEQPQLISTPPASLRIYADNTLRYSARLTIQMSCQMDFHYYPADTQRCNVDMKSYAYTDKIVVLDWREGKEASIKRSLQLSNFDIALGNTLNYSVKTSSAVYSGIRFTIILRRLLSFHMIQTYLPSALFVVVSWLSFLVAPESIPGRMTLCMTTLLTLTAMFAAVRQITPNVSYVKGLDIWMVTCVIFVFLTLVEYTVLLKLKRMNAKGKLKQRKKTKKSKKLKAAALSIHIPLSSVSEALERQNGPRSGSIPSFRKIESPKTNLEGSPRGNSIPNVFFNSSQGNGTPRTLVSASTQKVAPAAPEEEPTRNKYDHMENKIELYFSKIIPFLFVIFNFVYWPWLLLKADYYNEAEFLATHYAE